MGNFRVACLIPKGSFTMEIISVWPIRLVFKQGVVSAPAQVMTDRERVIMIQDSVADDTTSGSVLKQLDSANIICPTNFGRWEMELEVSVQWAEWLRIIVFRVTALAVEHAVAPYDRNLSPIPPNASYIHRGQKQGVTGTHAITDDRRDWRPWQIAQKRLRSMCLRQRSALVVLRCSMRWKMGLLLTVHVGTGPASRAVA